MPKSSPQKLAYNTKYQSSPEQKKKRAQRNAARREYEKAHGDLPRDVEIDHKTPIRKGGTNHGGNIRAVPRSENRAWRKGKKGYD